MAIIQTIPLGKKYESMTLSEAQAGTNTESQLISAKVLNDQIDEKISDIGLATVATSGSYNDLNDKPTIPTIPTVNNGTLTIQKNGENVKTFTANSSSNVTANITVPTKTSDLTNDTDYATGTNVADSLQEAKNYTDTTTSNMVTTNTSQTITSDKAFSGFLDYLVPLNQSEIPTVNTYKHFRYLGNDGLRLFNLQYCSRPDASRDAILYVYDKDGGVCGLRISTNNDVSPVISNAVSLGTSSNKWLNVYASNFYGYSGSFSNKVEAPLVRANADLGLILANKDSNAPTTTSGWNQVNFYDKNIVSLGYFQLYSDANANVYNWVGKKNSDSTIRRNIRWDVDADIFYCSSDNTISLGSSSYKWSQLHCTEITTYSQNFQRNIYGNYGTFWRQDDNVLYLLLTASGNQNGSYTTARPMRVNLATGVCDINGRANQDGDGNVISTTYAKVNNLVLAFCSSAVNNGSTVAGTNLKVASGGTGGSFTATTETLTGTYRALNTVVANGVGMFVKIA